jgi:hypothetical protein
MFNLLVHHSGWSGNRGSLETSRVFEYTADDLLARFNPSKLLDIDAVSKLPTLFMSESSGPGSQEARVGMITRIRTVGTSYQIEAGPVPWTLSA